MKNRQPQRNAITAAISVQTIVRWRHVDLFTGIGGFLLAAQRAFGERYKPVVACEIDKFCQKVIKKHWPNLPIENDIKEMDGFKYESIDLITAGFPCQDASSGNTKGKGIKGKRTGLYKHVIRIISEIQPRYALLENVANLFNRGFGIILGELAEIGYDAEWHCVPAHAVGAPHERDRIWIIAYPNIQRRQRPLCLQFGSVTQPGWSATPLDSPSDHFLQFEKGVGEPAVFGVDDGLPNRMDRLGAVGNSILPDIAEIFFRAMD